MIRISKRRLSPGDRPQRGSSRPGWKASWTFNEFEATIIIWSSKLPNTNLVCGMAWLQSTRTIRLNNRHRLTGHVLSGHYKAQLVEGSGNGYLRAACDYVHLNPVRAKLLVPQDRLLAYPWSSYPLYLAARDHRPKWLRADRLLSDLLDAY